MPTIFDFINIKKGGKVSEFNVLDQLKRLVMLQEGDTDFYNLKRELSEKPVLVEQLRNEFEEKKSRLNQLEEDCKKIQVQRNTMEGDLAKIEEDIRRADGQLAQIKTNKEYTAKIGEIEGLKADISLIEEKILETFDRADEIKALVIQEKEVVAREEETFNVKKQELEAEMKELDAKVKEVEVSRESLLNGVDKALLNRYERILDNKEGLAVVPLVGDNCGGCFMNLPPQMVNEIKMSRKIIFCEICSRILYSEDDVRAHQIAAPQIVKEGDPSEPPTGGTAQETAAPEVKDKQEAATEDKANNEAA